MIPLISVKIVLNGYRSPGLDVIFLKMFLKEATYAHQGCIIALKTAIFVI